MGLGAREQASRKPRAVGPRAWQASGGRYKGGIALVGGGEGGRLSWGPTAEAKAGSLWRQSRMLTARRRGTVQLEFRVWLEAQQVVGHGAEAGGF